MKVVAGRTPVAASLVPKAVSAPAARIKAPKGFQVDLIYSVPQATQGSWVNMTVDPKGRLIASDQYGKLYRITLPSAWDTKKGEIDVEPIDVPLGGLTVCSGPSKQSVRGRQPRPQV